MTLYPEYLKTYPNMNAPLPFHIDLHRLEKGYPSHRHDFLEFSFVVEGSGKETIDGVSHPMVPGAFTLILPYQVHELFTDPGTTLVLYNCNFSMELLLENGMNAGFGELLDEAGELPAYRILEGDAAREMRKRLEGMVREYHGKERWREALLKAQLTETLVCFDRCRRSAASPPPEPAAGRGGGRKNAVWEVILYIHRNYQEELSLTGLARRFSFSVSRMSEVIKEATGQTFVHFLHDLRIRQAAALLVSTDMSVTDIAHEVGFGSYKTFSRMFKEAKGVAPTAYRKNKAESRQRGYPP